MPLIFAVLAAVIALALWALRIPEGVKFAMQLSPGWNLANTLDAHGLGSGAGDPAVYEAYWGSAPVTEQQIDMIAAAGFHTLRVPVTWYEHMDTENRIDPIWLDRVQTVVDWALDQGMYVIVNAHHDTWYEPDPAKLQTAVATLRDVWEQIATRFQAYDTHLLFEGMNEPRLLGHPQEWAAGTPEARACVNTLNAAFVAAVRATGGANATRYLLVPAYAASVQEDALATLALPEDSHLMVSAHLYAPYDFALNEAGTADWSPDREADTRELREAFETLKRMFVSRGVPVVITEFGAVDKHNEAARAAWAATVTRLAQESRIPFLWWDTALLCTQTHTWRYPALLTALTH